MMSDKAIVDEHGVAHAVVILGALDDELYVRCHLLDSYRESFENKPFETPTRYTNDVLQLTAVTCVRCVNDERHGG